MNRKLTIRNIAMTLALQIITIAYGFVIPKLVLSYFGSETNGLVSSIGQFLSYIQLLEGGLGSVIMAALYKPLSDHDEKKISEIIKAAELFFRKIALIYLVYSVIVAVLYPLCVKSSFSFSFVATLTLIIAFSTFIQYFFALTYRLLITADRHGYIVSLANIIFLALNLGLSIVSVRIYPSIHLLKIINSVAFIVQPLIFSIYVKKNYHIEKDVEPDKNAIAQRWDGFGQNLAFFIHTNTDVVILTLFCTLKTVSVYSVYFMVIGSLKNLVIAISAAIKPSFGKALVEYSDEDKNKSFVNYDMGMGLVSTFCFTCCAIMIVSFVTVYTKGITDISYHEPLFAVIITFAEAIYCIRDPYVAVAYSTGKFRETASYAYIEAGMNIVLSIVLVPWLGMVGVAIGTAVSMVYRMVMHVIYVKKHTLYKPISYFVRNISIYIGGACIAYLISNLLFNLDAINTYFGWFIYACGVAVVVAAVLVVAELLFNHKVFIPFIKSQLSRGGKK